MDIERCQNPECNKPFKVSEHKLPFPGTKEKEPIICPYCRHTIERTSNGWWNTFAMTEQEIAEYEAR